MCSDGTYFGMSPTIKHIEAGISLLTVDCVACIMFQGTDYTAYDEPYLKSCNVSIISGDTNCGVILSVENFDGGTMGIGTAYLIGAVKETTTLNVTAEITSVYHGGKTLWSGSKTIDIEPIVISIGSGDRQYNRVIFGIYPEKREKLGK